MRDGTRKIVSVTEVSGMESETIVTQDIFSFEQTGYDDGKVVGNLKPSGIRPKFTPRLEAANIYLSPTVFGFDRAFFR